jgi:hypothetical protein
MADLAVVDTDTPFAIPGVVYTDKGLQLPPDLPFETWAAMGVTLDRMEKSIQWALSDWLNFGEQHYPDRYTQALEATHYEERGSLHNIAYVGRKFPNADMRHEALDFSHHQEVASLPAIVREELLVRAEQENLTTRQLRAEAIERKQIIKQGTPTWTIDAAETGPDFLVADTIGYGAQVHPDGNIYLYDKAGRKWHIPDLDDFLRRAYALKAEAQRHYGTWPQK